VLALTTPRGAANDDQEKIVAALPMPASPAAHDEGSVVAPPAAPSTPPSTQFKKLSAHEETPTSVMDGVSSPDVLATKARAQVEAGAESEWVVVSAPASPQN